jgi:hypothetical protein
VTDIIPHTGEEHCPDFEDIYKIFEFEEFLEENEVLEVY